jgi:hypothetical protein
MDHHPAGTVPHLNRDRVIAGLLVMLVGTALLADRLDWAGFHLNVPIWPWVVLLLGLGRLGRPRVDTSGRLFVNRTGLWFIFLGVWGLVNEYRLFGLHYRQTWPLLLIGAGALIVWHAANPPQGARTAAPTHES